MNSLLLELKFEKDALIQQYIKLKETLNLERKQLLSEIVSIKKQLANKDFKRQECFRKLKNQSSYTSKEWLDTRKEINNLHLWQKKATSSKRFKQQRMDSIKDELQLLNTKLKKRKVTIYDMLINQGVLNG